MTKENRAAFEKFDDYIRLRQKEGIADDTFDIREWVISNRYAQWNVGFVEENLQKKYAANLRQLFRKAVSVDDKKFGKSSHYMMLGTIYQDHQKSHAGAVRALQSFNLGDSLVLLEQGFLATSHSWSQSFQSGDPAMACLGYVYDDMAHYFMADYPNRLIHKLNSSDAPSATETTRAVDAINRIVTKKISKYNSQPIVDPAMTEGYARRVLVCDQAFADASTIYGKLTERDFEQMLLAAIRENPDAQILVKTHPDTHWEKGTRVGYYNHLEDTGRVRILREPINPFSLFAHVDKVYVGSSQMGLEALFAGKEVVCFGAPFYAGWGLTDDRQTVPHRNRTRTLEEIFHYFYVWYTIYHVPGCKVPSQIEDALDYIEDSRPVQLPKRAPSVSKTPKVSVILPVYGVEKYIDQCLTSLRQQTLEDIEIITVNDCSPDGSQAIIDRHAAEDSRIEPIVLKQNAGQGFARNAGIKAASGEYIFFLDSDDLLCDENVLAQAYKAGIEDHSDMVRVQKVVFQDGTSYKNGNLDGNEAHFSERKVIPSIRESSEILKSWHVWLFLYKRTLVNENNIRFASGQWEERGFVCEAYRRTNQITCLPIRGVAYRKRTDSTMSNERGNVDLEMFLTNIASIRESMKETIGEGLARYQMLNAIMLPQWWNTVKKVAANDGNDSVLGRIAEAFGDVKPKEKPDLSEFPMLGKQRPRLELGLSAIQASRWDLLEIAAERLPLRQADYIQEMLHKPENDVEQQLQQALSLYARNELVARDGEAARMIRGIHQKPRLLIHIGATKTGSTTIQHFLENNRAALLRGGVYVPEVGLFWQEVRPHKQAGHAQFVPEAMQGKKDLKMHLEAAQALCNGNIHTVILSSEAYFLNDNAVELARHFSDYDVEMLTYLRRQDDWANSQYAEFVAGGAVGRVDQPIDEWLKTDKTRDRLDYYARMRLWETVIPKSKIHIGIYDRKTLLEGDIISDFLAMAELEGFDDLPRPEARQENRFPFGTAHVNLIRRLNQNNWSDRNAYFNFIEESGRNVTKIRERSDMPLPQPNLLTQSQRLAIMESVSSSNEKLASEFLGREGGVLFGMLEHKDSEKADAISVEEFDAIMNAYDRWKPKPAAKPKHPRPAHSTLPINATQEDYAAQLLPTKQTLVFKLFVLGGSRMGVQKFAKLKRDPDQFFSDMSWTGAAVVRKILSLERRARG